MNVWKENAKIVYKEYGSQVDYNEGFYVCPDCGEPIYINDWSEEELTAEICPICGFNGEDAYDDEPADIDSDCGFDPYMGMFTDDC